LTREVGRQTDRQGGHARAGRDRATPGRDDGLEETVGQLVERLEVGPRGSA